MTNAIWRYENGAMGQLLHGVSLHDGEYSVELCVLADGWLLKLVEPYNEAPRLYIRQPGKVEGEPIEAQRVILTDPKLSRVLYRPR